jgi:hypothetical protein
MTVTQDLGLVTGTLHDDHLVHLFERPAPQALCCRGSRGERAAAGFRTAPCQPCLDSALARGHAVARENGHAYINLRRIAVPI